MNAYTLVTKKKPIKIANHKSQHKIIKKKIIKLNTFGRILKKPNGKIKIILRLIINQNKKIQTIIITLTFMTKFTNFRNNLIPSVIGVKMPKKHTFGPLRIWIIANTFLSHKLK